MVLARMYFGTIYKVLEDDPTDYFLAPKLYVQTY